MLWSARLRDDFLRGNGKIINAIKLKGAINMKLKKLLSLFVCTLLVVSTLGVFSVSAATADETINLPIGLAYDLPAEVGGVAVTAWTDASGATVTAADTSKFGYNIYTGTTESGTVTYRVNVGELVETFSDDMNAHYTTYTNDAKTTGTNTVTKSAVTGGTFTIGKYDIATNPATAATQNSQHFESVGDNTFLSIGPGSTSTWDTKWTLTNAITDSFKYSFKFKVDKMNMATKRGNIAPLQWRIDGKDWFQLRINSYAEGTANHSANGKINFTGFDYNEDGSARSGTNADEYFHDLIGTTIDENEVLTTDWFDVDIIGYDSKYYEIYVNDTKVFSTIDILNENEAENDRYTYLPAEAQDGVGNIIVAKRSKVADADVRMLMDDVKFSKLVYYSGDVSTATAAVAQGADSEQTTTLTLTLSDGTTKDVTVAYTADTTEAGTKTAVGTIEGFSEKVTVTYNVLPVSAQTINATVGQTVTLADGSTVTPEAMGVLKETVSYNGEIINYTINVSGYVVKYSDDLQNHTNTTWTDSKGTVSWQTINPGTANGLTLRMNNETSGTCSAVMVEDGAEKYAKMSFKTADGNMKWYPDEPVSGKYQVKARVKAENFANNGGGIGNYFKLVDTNGRAMTHAIALRSYLNSGYMQIRQIADGPFPNGSNAVTYSGVRLYETTHKVSYTTKGIDWFTLRIDVDTDAKTYEVFVNDVSVFANGPVALQATDASGILNYIDYDARSAANDGYIDDVTVSVLDSFDGNMPSINTVAGMGAEGEVSSKIELTTVGGAKFYPTATFAVDTSKVGNKTAFATIEGFTDPVTVNVKVCNYNVVAGDGKAVLTNISGLAGATVLVAYYNESDVFIKADDLKILILC